MYISCIKIKLKTLRGQFCTLTRWHEASISGGRLRVWKPQELVHLAQPAGHLEATCDAHEPALLHLDLLGVLQLIGDHVSPFRVMSG